MNYPEHLKNLTVVYFRNPKNEYWYAFSNGEFQCLSTKSLFNLIECYEFSTMDLAVFGIDHKKYNYEILASAPLRSFAELYPEHLL